MINIYTVDTDSPDISNVLTERSRLRHVPDAVYTTFYFPSAPDDDGHRHSTRHHVIIIARRIVLRDSTNRRNRFGSCSTPRFSGPRAGNKLTAIIAECQYYTAASILLYIIIVPGRRRMKGLSRRSRELFFHFILFFSVGNILR